MENERLNQEEQSNFDNEIQNEVINESVESPNEDTSLIRRGRPSVSYRQTKISVLLNDYGMTQKDLVDGINNMFPNSTVSNDSISRIVSGRRAFYLTSTLFKICAVLDVTPNDILDYENVEL